MVNNSSPEGSPSSGQVQDFEGSTAGLKAPIPSCFVGLGAEPKQNHEGNPSTGYRPTDESKNYQSTYSDQDDNGIPTRG